jgi:alpha-L-fucosidase
MQKEKRIGMMLIILAALLTGAIMTTAAETSQPANPRAQQQESFRNARFGMFIHWGLYSIPAGEWNGKKIPGLCEWVMHEMKITVPEYEKLASQFNPTEYDPAEWVRIAKNAGMKYITITSKHHDGFALWDSKVSDWDIADKTPYKKDVLKMLADECAKQDMPLFFYHSHLDWHHPDYFPRGHTGQFTGRPESGDFNKYIDYMNSQIAELCSGRYGKIAGFWFDGWWDQQVKSPGKETRVDWRLKETYELIHRLQPQALIGNNHHEAPFEGEDFQMFERGVPGQDKYSKANFVSALPLETCDTMNDSWGYNKSDSNFKSTKQLIHYLVMTAGYNANFLLDIGPMPTGKIQPEFVQRLEEIGKWMNQNGQTIYGTRGGPFPPQSWGATTRKADTIYVHILKRPENGKLELPETNNIKVQDAGTFTGKTKVAFTQNGNIVLDLTNVTEDPIDTIVVLKLDSPNTEPNT